MYNHQTITTISNNDNRSFQNKPPLSLNKTLRIKTKSAKTTSNNKQFKYDDKSFVSPLKLQRRDARHIKDVIKLSPKRNYGRIDVDHCLVQSFRDHPLRKFRYIFYSGLIDYKSDDVCPKIIVDLCQKYLYNQQDEIYHIGYILHISLKKINKKSITYQMLIPFIKHYFKTKDKQKIKLYCKKLIKLKYLVLIKTSSKNLYKIPMEKQICFDTYNK